MLKNFLRKQNPLKLGRWNITYDNATLEKKINWANHDHCGSELCDKQFINDKLKNIKKEKKIKQDKDKDKDKDKELYYIPYCI
tara:strand:- start:171 stop:419 length:249 start_codon:yes stop_codon:yes gene_type:complete